MSELLWDEIDRRAVDTARVLAADAVQKVGNGHPGTAMSLAPVAYLLYQRVMRHDPADTHWIGRDRFVLSVGHSSLTQYIQLYLGGFGLELTDLESLRTWGSLTPGHPEYGHTKGVEITTGPLGQGLASAVGFAYASRYERGLFDPDAAAGTSPFDHYVYVIAGDGDLQEGVTSEASSLAGHQQLGNLIAIYDSNRISIEGDTNVAFTEEVRARYESYGWQVQHVDWVRTGTYVEDVKELFDAIEQAKAETSKPSLIILNTIIGWPAPNKKGTESVHGNALGADEVAETKVVLGFDPEQSFVVEDAVIAHTRELGARAAERRAAWQQDFDAWAAANPERKALLERLEAHELPEGIEDVLPVFEAGTELATRAASGKVINALAPELPELWGGSADLAGSNNTTIAGAKSFIPAAWSTHDWDGSPYGRVLHFGIREHAMGSILNGIVLHGPTRPFGGTFLIFSDYMRPAVRLAALMNVPSVFVWTHDSVALGEDGPT
ncbi:transketolase, partial [Microbacterium sp. 13-71-7]|uniref:transketolase family protein n=1 Tax=Microbacterium sp. 13-71-7 TaxID=1970399 RepID=UPI000BD7B2FA